jgi:hypothetical protein
VIATQETAMASPSARCWAAAFAALAFTLSACAPGTPDADSWRADARRAVGDASSALSSAELALRQGRADRIYDPYLQTVVVDAEEAVATAASTIGGKQPPRSERERYDAVTGQPDEAASLVSTARIAVVDEDASRYEGLATRLAQAADALHALESDLQHPPQ